MRTLLCLLIAVTLAVAADVDVTGKWAGSLNITNSDGGTKEATALLILKQTGSEITGTVGPREDDQTAIQKGKIEGNKITLEAEHNGHTLKLELLVAGDRMTGDASLSGDGGIEKAKVEVTKAK